MAQYKTLNNFANEFSSSTNYAVGDLVMYLGELYKCTTAHNGAWDSADFTKTNIQQSTSGVNYTTTAPSSNNTSGRLEFVVLSSEPATKYDGYIYIITGA